tara:strand:- start:797 stop:2152 length:1356 start_codon:yes stop_codon:yes gene_type:complete
MNHRAISFRCFLTLLVAVLPLALGCTKESEEEAVESGPPESTESARYDHPEGEPGFSPDSPTGHCMVFAGYDSVNMELYLSDPGDNLETGHQDKATFKPHEINFINGYCTTVIAETPATFTGAIIVQPPGRKTASPPERWTQYGMPDLSQHAIQPEWQCYCAPTSAANVISYFADSYPELSPRETFAKDSNFQTGKEWLRNRLIAGNRAPFPKSKSLAHRMSTTVNGGTSMKDILVGVRSYLDDNAKKPQEWSVELVLENENSPDGEALWKRLTGHCAAGDGVLLCVLWGIPVPPSSSSGANQETVREDGDQGGETDGEAEEGENQPQGDEGDGSSVPEPPVERNPSVEKGSDGIEIDVPKIELETRPKREIIDEKAIIVDDFNLTERNGLWYQRGSNTPFTGKARRSYPNGTTLMEIPYVEGKKHGIQTIWEEDGKVMRKVLWKKGKVDR